VKVSTLCTWVTVALLTLFIFANWRRQDIYLLPDVWGWRCLVAGAGVSAGLGFAMAHFIRLMNKDQGGGKKK